MPRLPHRVSRSDRIVIAAGGGALVLAIAAAWVLLAPAEGDAAGPLTAAGEGLSLAATSGSVTPSPSAQPSGQRWWVHYS